jgi:amidase
MKRICEKVMNFSKDNAPVYTAEPGEVMLFQTLDCFGGQIKSEDQVLKELDLSKANPGAGPVYIKGAEKGDVLVVDILDITVEELGVACVLTGLGPLADKCDVRTRQIPVKDGVASFQGVNWHVDPMIGVIGTAPAEGAVPNGFAGNHGGNMDSKLVKKGARLYFPVRVPGALLHMGDIHASQGDGELCGHGIEIPGEIMVKVSLIKGVELNWPLTETRDYWYVNTTSTNYEDSQVMACEELARLACPAYGWDITDFFIYLSLQGELEVNQGLLPMMPPNPPMINVRVGIPKLANKKRLI